MNAYLRFIKNCTEALQKLANENVYGYLAGDKSCGNVCW